MLQHLVMNEVSRLWVHSERQILIQKAEWVFVHLDDLVVENVIVITEIIYYVIAWMIFQILYNLGGRDRNKLKVQDF